MGKKKKTKKKKKNSKKNFSFFQDLSNHFELDSNFTLFEVIIIILISVIFGVIIGYLLTYGNSNLRRVRSDSNLGEIVGTYNNIIDNYYGKLDKDKLSTYAIKGMISSLDDPYSSFMDKNSTDSFNESVDGEYVGIGVTVEYHDEYNHILSVTKDGPAFKAGIQQGDTLLSIDGQDCHNMLPDKLRSLVDGEVGTITSLQILRGEDILTFSVKRNVIEVHNVIYDVIEKDKIKIGYIKINLFSSNSYDQFEEALQSLEKKKIKRLIIDVRDNPGGHLAQVSKVLSLFFDKKTVLYQIETKGSKKKIYSTTDEKRTYPIVVFINGETASAAEVMAACFQDNYKDATIIGTNSYGKANVQKSLSLSTGTSIKFTIEKWLSPKGKSVSGKGITPDERVEVDGENDLFMEKAFEILK